MVVVQTEMVTYEALEGAGVVGCGASFELIAEINPGRKLVLIALLHIRPLPLKK
jgi:hypothetical protein